jgi:hypothetical protein
MSYANIDYDSVILMRFDKVTEGDLEEGSDFVV